MAYRSTQEVFEDHLRLRKQGEPETDIEQNYAADVVVMSNFGIFHGREGVRRSERLLHQQLPQRHYTYVQCLTDQEIAFEKWDGSSAQTRVKDGIDFFLIRKGYIQRVSILPGEIGQNPLGHLCLIGLFFLIPSHLFRLHARTLLWRRYYSLLCITKGRG